MTYLLQVSTCWILFYGIYLLFLRKETFFTINRYYLLGALGLGLLIPFIGSMMPANEASVEVYQVMTQFAAVEVAPQITLAETTEPWFTWTNILWSIYILGGLVVLSRFIYGLHRIYTIYKNSDKTPQVKYTLVESDKYHLPFSFFHFIFISKQLPLNQEVEKVLQHEELHANQWHSLDIVFTELLQVFFWFNPILIFYKGALRQSHEYLADAYVTQNHNKNSYGRLLLQQSTSGLEIALANQFFHSQIKKRITMMYKEKSKRSAIVKYLAAVPVLVAMLVIFSSNQMEDPDYRKEEMAKQFEAVYDKVAHGGVDFMTHKVEWDNLLNSFANPDNIETVEADFADIARQFGITLSVANKEANRPYSFALFHYVVPPQKIEQFKTDSEVRNTYLQAINDSASLFGVEYDFDIKVESDGIFTFPPTELNTSDISAYINSVGKEHGEVKLSVELGAPNSKVAAILECADKNNIKVILKESAFSPANNFDGRKIVKRNWHLLHGKYKSFEGIINIKAEANAKGDMVYVEVLKEGTTIDNKIVLKDALKAAKGFKIEKGNGLSTGTITFNLGKTSPNQMYSFYEDKQEFHYDKQISLGLEVPKGSVIVTVGDQLLVETEDYSINYESGMMEITNDQYIGQPVNVQFEDVQSDAKIKRRNLTTNNSIEGVILGQNTPNPWRQTTSFKITTDSDINGVIKVHNIQGDVLMTRKLSLAKGDNFTNINRRDVGDKYGVYYCTLYVSDEEVTTRKMILIDGDENNSDSGSVDFQLDKNLPIGSVIVKAEGKPLSENLDYTVDYKEGKISLLKKLDPSTPIVVSVMKPNESSPSKKDLIDGAESLFGLANMIEKRTINFDQEDQTDPVFKVVEEMPRFPGCEEMQGTAKEIETCAKQKMLEYIYSNLKYPASARDQDVEGIVVVQFIVEKDGSITGAKKVRDIGAGCGDESQRVVESMPTWRPGMQKGKAVRVQYTLPVKFKLESKKVENSKKVDKKVTVVGYGEPNEITKKASLQKNTISRKHQDPSVYKVVEKMPQFVGCEDEVGEDGKMGCSTCAQNKMLEYIYTRIKYPKEARDKGIDGMAVVQFIVNTDGSLSDFSIARNPGAGLGEEAKRVLESMPTWIPGEQDGKKVKVLYTMPVKFKLEGDNGKKSQPSSKKQPLKQGKVTLSEFKKIKGISAFVPHHLKEDCEVERYRVVLVNQNENAKLINSNMTVRFQDETIALLRDVKIGSRIFIENIKMTCTAGENIEVSPISFMIVEKADTDVKKILEGKTAGTDIKNGEKSNIIIGDPNGAKPLYVINGKIKPDNSIESINPDDIKSIIVLKGEKANEKYGTKGDNGVIEIEMKPYNERSHYLIDGQMLGHDFYKSIEKHHINTEKHATKEEKFMRGLSGELTIVNMLAGYGFNSAYFPGTNTADGSDQALMAFVGNNIIYPKAAIDNNIEGVVAVRYTVEANGQLTNFKIGKSQGWGLDQAVLDMMEKLAEEKGPWRAAYLDRRSIATSMILPVKFKLQGDHKKEAKSRKLTVSKFEVNPNPSDGRFNISYELEDDAPASLTFYTSNGQVIKTIDNLPSKNNLQVDLSTQTSSTIYVSLEQGKKLKTIKASIQN